MFKFLGLKLRLRRRVGAAVTLEDDLRTLGQVLQSKPRLFLRHRRHSIDCVPTVTSIPSGTSVQPMLAVATAPPTAQQHTEQDEERREKQQWPPLGNESPRAGPPDVWQVDDGRIVHDRLRTGHVPITVHDSRLRDRLGPPRHVGIGDPVRRLLAALVRHESDLAAVEGHVERVLRAGDRVGRERDEHQAHQEKALHGNLLGWGIALVACWKELRLNFEPRSELE